MIDRDVFRGKPTSGPPWAPGGGTRRIPLQIRFRYSVEPLYFSLSQHPVGRLFLLIPWGKKLISGFLRKYSIVFLYFASIFFLLNIYTELSYSVSVFSILVTPNKTNDSCIMLDS